MRATLINIILLLVLFFFGSCVKHALTPVEYMQYIENEKNGLRVKKTVSEFEFVLQYKPIEYVMLMETKDPNTNTVTAGKYKNELTGFQYYTLKIRSTANNELLAAGISDEREYYQRLEYFMSAMQDDISLVEGKDTLPCTLFHYERVYGVGPYTTFVLGFPDDPKGEIKDKQFIYDDHVLGTGRIEEIINATNIKAIPKLLLKQ